MKKYRVRNAQVMREYLNGHPCVDCGESDVRVLEFDHVGNAKLENVATLCGQGVGLIRLKAEIAKCQVRCANCHRRRTAAQFGWWRNLGT
jgi:ribose 5-phosphate isomerase RpiB